MYGIEVAIPNSTPSTHIIHTFAGFLPLSL
jgi:hypothetical protein